MKVYLPFKGFCLVPKYTYKLSDKVEHFKDLLHKTLLCFAGANRSSNDDVIVGGKYTRCQTLKLDTEISGLCHVNMQATCLLDANLEKMFD